MLNMDVVAPDYFKTLGIPVLRGRGFTDADRADAPAVVVVSESAARHYWRARIPSASASGWEPIWSERSRSSVWCPTRATATCGGAAQHLLPTSSIGFSLAPLALAIRTSGPPDELVSGIRRVISETEPGVALTSAASFETYLDGRWRSPV